MKAPHENAMTVVLFSDLKRLFWRHLDRLKIVALVCGLAVFALLLLIEPRYAAEATFKQAGRSQDVSLNVREIFQHVLPSGAENGTAAVMSSNQVLKTTVEALGLQVRQDSGFFLWRGLKRIGENLFCELTQKLPETDPFCFENVTFLGEQPLRLLLKWTEENSFQCFNSQKQLIAEGKIGEPLQLPELTLTLATTAQNITPGKWYGFTIEPWRITVERLKKSFQVRPLKTDKQILQLSFSHRNRHLASDFLNQVMVSYQKYLKKENEEICQAQLAYLKQRQHELIDDLDLALGDHAAYLRENIGRNGFLGFAQELETLSQPQNLYTAKLFDLDVELKRLIATSDPLKNEEKQEGPFSLVSFQKDKILRLDSLDLEQQRQLELGIAQEETSDFSGLSLETAQKLMVDYTQQRDTMQAEMKELIYLMDHLARPDFELSSLGVVIHDPVTSELVQQASTIALQLKDSNNRGPREQERLLETLNTQKSFLSQYILQTVDLKKLRIKLLEEKIAVLRARIVNLLQVEKGLLGQKLHEISFKMSVLPEKWRRESLLKLQKEMSTAMIQSVSQVTETKKLNQHTYQVASRPLDLAVPPVHAKAPKILLLSLLAAFLGALSYYGYAFSQALLKGFPASDENLRLAGFPVGGALSRHSAFPLSQLQSKDIETLRRLAEFLTSQHKQDALVAACIRGHYPDYAPALAEMLALRGLKVLVIQATFQQVVRPEQIPGLYQALENQQLALPIRHHVSYDELPSGGTSRHGAELLSSLSFHQLLSRLKPEYDIILLMSDAEAAKAEGLAPLKMADVALIAVQQERKDELSVYCEWARKKGTDCTRFIYAQE